MVQFNNADLPVGNALELIDRFRQLIQIYSWVFLGIFVFKGSLLKINGKYNRNIRNPPLVFQVGSILHSKAFAVICGQRIERDFDAVTVKVLIQNFLPGNSRHQCGNPLLAVDQHFLSI